MTLDVRELGVPGNAALHCSYGNGLVATENERSGYAEPA